MISRSSIWRLASISMLLLFMLLIAACSGGDTTVEEDAGEGTGEELEDGAGEETGEEMEDDEDLGDEEEMLDEGTPIFYADYWTWPFEGDKLAQMARGKFYVPVQDESKIVIIDPDAEDYGLKFVDVAFEQPHHPWMSPGMRYVYINYQSEGKGDHDAISILDTFTDEIVKDINTGINDPFHGSFSPLGTIFITGNLDTAAGNVHFFDLATNELIASPETTGLRTRDILISHDGKYAFIGHQGYDPDNGVLGSVDIMDIETQEVVATVGEGRCRSGRMSNDGTLAFFSCDRANKIIAIDTSTFEVVAEIVLPEGAGPFNISFRADDKFAYVGLKKLGQIGVIDVEKFELVKTLDSGTDTNSTYFHPYAPLAVVTNDGTDAHVTILNTDTNEIVGTIDTGKGTHNGQWSADGRWFLVSNRLDESVTLLKYNEDTGEIEWYDDIVVGFGTNGVVWAPYFCGVDSLTTTNVETQATNAPANADGTCQ